MLAKGRPTKITKNCIASKCLELYWNKGLHNVTYNEAIKYSNYSKPTVYNLFKSEDELQAKTLEYYDENHLIHFANAIHKQDNILNFIEVIFENVKSNYCYFVISNSNRYLLNKLSKSYTIKIEKKFKKAFYNLITRHVKKFKLKTQDNEISSLVIYLIHNITLINTLRLNKANEKDFVIIKNAMIKNVKLSLSSL
ncbi:TetR/AcrR family transcriptional regulator [Alphaproteobacteria bacterium]|nr:TetR/AcrR family transcriptional regulator [Alphaproteobacteria bacterium]